MSHIDDVKGILKQQGLFHGESGPTYVRIMDTPRIWGQPFGRGIMRAAIARTREFEEVVSEVIQKTVYRCDLASLNSPDPSWAKVIFDAMDKALSAKIKRDRPPQFRFLFGQTPMMLMTGTPANFIDFRASLLRLVQARRSDWDVMPDIWLGRFFRIQDGVLSGLGAYGKSFFPSGIFGDLAEEDDAATKMTWNHSKIIAADGVEALVGGHNLNMDLFTSYPPVHDVSVVVHGEAAYDAQLYLNQMWECKSNLLVKEQLDTSTPGAPKFKNVSDDGKPANQRKPEDPLAEPGAIQHMYERAREFLDLHGAPLGKQSFKSPFTNSPFMKEPPKEQSEEIAEAIRNDDLQTLKDLDEPLFQQETYAGNYAGLKEYRRATRVLSVGKYWTGPNMKTDYKAASELMKRSLITGAKRILRLSQMDLISAWKKKWESHVVCRWIMQALLKNPDLIVQVVVSPLNAGAGAEGDQYSFGSGARRTFDLFQYYSMYDLDDQPLSDVVVRLESLGRLHIAPFYYTKVGPNQSTEGGSYQWPDLDPKGWTNTVRQPSLTAQPPRKGVIGNAVESAKMGSGKSSKYKPVPSAPGNHAKIMIVDDESYVVGSDNLYPGFLSEFNYLVEGAPAVNDLLKSYWEPLWRYSGQHCVNPHCKEGCSTSKDSKRQTPKLTPRTAPSELASVPDVSLLGAHNAGRVKRIEFGALAQQDLPKPTPNLAKESQKEESVRVSQDSEEVSQEEKARRARAAVGVEAFPPDDQLPDLTAPGYNLTEDDIYHLQRYYLRNAPNIAVIAGVADFQWNEMTHLAYTTGVHPAITTDTDTIVQAFHVGGNHWALLYITLGEAKDDGSRPARLLYIDPLNPNAVPDRLGLLRRPFPGIQAEHALIRYQNDKDLYGQNSCGVWVVELARQLVQGLNVLPDRAQNRHQAALDLRAEMNRDLETARARPLPVAPGDQTRWVRTPLRTHDDLHMRPKPGPQRLQRSASFGHLPKKT